MRHVALLGVYGLLVAAGFALVCSANAQTRKIKKEVQRQFVPDADGNLVPDTSEITKLYDKRGNIIEEMDRSFWPELNRVVIYDKKYFYDARGRCDSTLTFIDGAPALTLKPHYDASGREIAAEEITAERKPGYRTRTLYKGPSKRKSRMEMYNSDGILYNVKNYRYDKRGNVVEELASEGGEPRYRWLYKYDANNRLMERTDYSGSGTFVQRHAYEYDADQKISRETVVNASGRVERVVTYRYDYY